MEEIIEEYGRAFLKIVSISLVVFVIFFQMRDNEGHQGVFAIVGSHMTTEGNDYPSYTDFDKFVSEGLKTSPEITYAVSGQMYVGTNQLGSYLSVKGYDGTNVPYKIASVTDYSGNKYPDAYDAALQTITFPKTGVYKLRIKAVDNINQKITVDVSIPVVQQ